MGHKLVIYSDFHSDLSHLSGLQRKVKRKRNERYSFLLFHSKLSHLRLSGRGHLHSVLTTFGAWNCSKYLRFLSVKLSGWNAPQRTSALLWSPVVERFTSLHLKLSILADDERLGCSCLVMQNNSTKLSTHNSLVNLKATRISEICSYWLHRFS